MKTQITKNKDVIIVRLQGLADVESVVSLNQTCDQHLLQKKIIFNLADLNFVGSSGIAALTGILKKLSQNSRLKVCSVGSEFRRIFASSHLEDLEIYETEDKALKEF